jgi:hypothetical protein
MVSLELLPLVFLGLLPHRRLLLFLVIFLTHFVFHPRAKGLAPSPRGMKHRVSDSGHKAMGGNKVDRKPESSPQGDLSESDVEEGEYKLVTQIPHWTYSSQQARKDPFGENEFCSKQCFKIVRSSFHITKVIADNRKHGMLEKVILGPWSQAQRDTLHTSAGVLRNNPRCACLCASIINKPCAEVFNSRLPKEQRAGLMMCRFTSSFGPKISCPSACRTTC